MNEDEFAELLETGAHPSGRHGGDDARRVEDLRALLADEAVWVEPDPGGVEALLDAVRREPASPWEAAGAGARSVPPIAADYSSNGRGAHAAPRRSEADGRRRGGLRRRRAPLVAVAAALALIAGIAGAMMLGGDEHPGKEFALVGTELSPGAKAWATVDPQSAGVSIWLNVHGLAPAKKGTYYEAWVESAEGRVPVGTFHMRGGDGWIYLWSGVDPAEYPTLNVTLEDEGPDQSWSGKIVLTGKIVA